MLIVICDGIAWGADATAVKGVVSPEITKTIAKIAETIFDAVVLFNSSRSPLD